MGSSDELGKEIQENQPDSRMEQLAQGVQKQRVGEKQRNGPQRRQGKYYEQDRTIESSRFQKIQTQE